MPAMNKKEMIEASREYNEKIDSGNSGNLLHQRIQIKADWRVEEARGGIHSFGRENKAEEDKSQVGERGREMSQGSVTTR